MTKGRAGLRRDSRNNKWVLQINEGATVDLPFEAKDNYYMVVEPWVRAEYPGYEIYPC